MARFTLVIGDKRYSSWSLRPWILMRHAGLAFDEVLIPLRQPDTRQQILRHSPAGKVPVLIDGGVRVWESLAICEYLADLMPDRHFWPVDPATRAFARAAATEMHGGFANLRRDLPLDVELSTTLTVIAPETQADIDRIGALWREARLRFGAGGPFLFGRFTIADAMYAPVCSRFRSYGVPLDALLRDYVDAVMEMDAMKAWIDGA